MSIAFSRPPSPSGTSAGRAFFTFTTRLRRTGPSAEEDAAATLGFFFRGPLGFFLAAAVARPVPPPGETVAAVAPGDTLGDFPAAAEAGGSGGVAARPVGSPGTALLLKPPAAAAAGSNAAAPWSCGAGDSAGAGPTTAEKGDAGGAVGG